ncbi:restriction endonuclease subunit S [Marinilabilia rubra]|uniref:restriction endonuclease subunit S n=1 Tax=Marinilabilia rubra TaxID=2162893 RepID=UPI001304D41F|nr:restriction endonuclease subunit S [Marinilabilia rubra]
MANIVGANMRNYKIIRKNQFACSIMQVRRDGKMPVALLQEFDEAIISQAYPVFEVKDENILLPEYLMMWFSRPEFDREACFYAVGGVRGSLEWEDFCNMKLPIPSIETQRAIVAEYNAVKNRIALNNQLIQKLEETAQAIYKQWFVDFEFPDENGNPYKSSGGKMVFNEELEKEIPEGWEVSKLNDICEIKGGKRLPKGGSLNENKDGNPYIKVADMVNDKHLILKETFEYVDYRTQENIKKYIVSENDLIISIVGTIGLVKIIDRTLHKANLTENCVKLTNYNQTYSDVLYHSLVSDEGQRLIKSLTVGGVQGKLPIYNIQLIPILLHDQTVSLFNDKIQKINSNLLNFQKQTNSLFRLEVLLLSKLTSLKN